MDVTPNIGRQELIAFGILLFWFLIFLGAITAGLTAIVTHHIRKSRRDEMEATLKMEMIQRGMSVDDMQKLLAAMLSPSEPEPPPSLGYSMLFGPRLYRSRKRA